MRSRTLTNSSSETPTCVTSLKRRSRRISQQMLALLSSHSVGVGNGKDEQQQLKSGSGQTESQSWTSPMASKGTLTTMGTTSGLHRAALERNTSGDVLDYYYTAPSDHPRDRDRDARSPSTTAYPPQPHAAFRGR